MPSAKAREIDEITKLKIFGYSRKMENEFSIAAVPIIIQYIIMLYYWINEKFTDHGRHIRLSGNNTIANAIQSNIAGKTHLRYNTVYGNNVINIDDKSINKYSWTIKVNKLGLNGLINFGLDSSKNKYIDGDFSGFGADSIYYSIGTDGWIRHPDVSTSNMYDAIVCGDKIQLILEMSDEYGQLSYNVAGKSRDGNIGEII